MASRVKHAERSHYSYHTKAPFHQFHRSASIREYKKEQKSMMETMKEGVKNFFKKNREPKSTAVTRTSGKENS